MDWRGELGWAWEIVRGWFQRGWCLKRCASCYACFWLCTQVYELCPNEDICEIQQKHWLV